MGKASSNKKVARAAKAAGRPGARKNYVWPVTIGAVVLLGVVLIVASFGGGPSEDPPQIGDHWHAAYGVMVCDSFRPPLSDAGPDESGIHSHGDGLVHIHPFSTRFTGEDANLAAFGGSVDLDLQDDALTLPGGETFANGDDCGDEPGMVQVKVWDGPEDDEGRLLAADLAAFAPQDGDLVTIAFAPEGADIPKPPSAGAQPTDVVPAPGETVPEGAPSTLPTDDGASDGADGDDGTTGTTTGGGTGTSDTSAP